MMENKLKPYLWQFFRYYFLGYLVGLAMLFAAAYLLGVRLQDLFLVVILCVVVPNSISMNFVQAEKRYFAEDEQKTMIKKSSLIALGISIIPTLIYLGFFIGIKLFLPPQEIPKLLTDMSMGSDKDMLNQLLQLNVWYLIGIFLLAILLYYGIIRLIIGGSYKRMGRRFSKGKPIAKS